MMDNRTPLEINDPLPIWDLYETFLEDPQIEYEVHQVLKNGAKNGRDYVTRYVDAMQGIALQYAVMQYLMTTGHNVSRPPDGILHYDFIVDGFKVDVKGRFTGKYWQQSDYEAAKIKETGDDVLYFCVDCYTESQRPNPQERFIYRGQSMAKDLCTVHYQPFVIKFDKYF